MSVAKKFADDMNISLEESIRILDELMNKLKPEEIAVIDENRLEVYRELAALRDYASTGVWATPTPIAAGTSAPTEVTININAPLVNIEGSADRRTAVIAAETMKESLRNVIVEASSTAADATHKQIRAETTVTTGVGKVGNIYGGPGFQKRWVQQ